MPSLPLTPFQWKLCVTGMSHEVPLLLCPCGSWSSPCRPQPCSPSSFLCSWRHLWFWSLPSPVSPSSPWESWALYPPSPSSMLSLPTRNQDPPEHPLPSSSASHSPRISVQMRPLAATITFSSQEVNFLPQNKTIGEFLFGFLWFGPRMGAAGSSLKILAGSKKNPSESGYFVYCF